MLTVCYRLTRPKTVMILMLGLQAPLGAAEVVGRITDTHSGHGISQAIVRAVPDHRKQRDVQAVTDHQGHYVLDLLKGRYKIYIDVPNSNYLSRYYSRSSGSDEGDFVEIPTYESFVVLNFGLEMGGSIAGSVTGQSTQVSLENVRIYAESADLRTSTLTRNDGSYVFRGLPPGKFLIHVGTLDEQYAPVYFDDVFSAEEATTITLARYQEMAQINFNLREAAIIQGRVRLRQGLKPLEGIKVVAEKEGSSYTPKLAYTDAQGKYSIRGLSDGSYLLEASPPEREGTPSNHRGRLLTQFYPDQFDRNLAARLKVEAGTTLSNIDFSLSIGSTISGRVISLEDESPLAKVQIIPQLVDGETLPPRRRETTQSGAFLLEDLPSGQYFLGISLPEQYNHLMEVYYENKLSPTKADKIELEAGEHMQEVDFYLSPGASLRGRLTVEEPGYKFDPNKDKIQLKRLGFDPLGYEEREFTITQDGYFFVEGTPSGRYSLTPKTSDPNLIARTSPVSRVLDIVQGDVIEKLDFVFGLGGSISGMVHAKSNIYHLEDLQIVLINLFENTSIFFDISSNQYTITGISPGRYFLVLRSNPRKTNSRMSYVLARIFDTRLVEVEKGVRTSRVTLKVPQAVDRTLNFSVP